MRRCPPTRPRLPGPASATQEPRVLCLPPQKNCFRTRLRPRRLPSPPPTTPPRLAARPPGHRDRATHPRRGRRCPRAWQPLPACCTGRQCCRCKSCVSQAATAGLRWRRRSRLTARPAHPLRSRLLCGPPLRCCSAPAHRTAACGDATRAQPAQQGEQQAFRPGRPALPLRRTLLRRRSPSTAPEPGRARTQRLGTGRCLARAGRLLGR
mmetsp:Transcript_26318/g.99009  ORF Transcript_26318/g.99009 Transcript_26318/m.99009 type:complete len:209 (+) Transcript_26318:463-1089(+)